jgi:hypothetical protein
VRASLGELSEFVKSLLKFAAARAAHAAEHAATPTLAEQILAEAEGGRCASWLPGGKVSWGPDTQCWVWEYANPTGPAGLPAMASTQAYSLHDLQIWINQVCSPAMTSARVMSLLWKHYHLTSKIMMMPVEQWLQVLLLHQSVNHPVFLHIHCLQGNYSPLSMMHHRSSPAKHVLMQVRADWIATMHCH